MKKIKTYSSKKKPSKKEKAIKNINSFRDANGIKRESDIERMTRLLLEQLNMVYVQEYAVLHVSPKDKKMYYKVYDFYVSNGKDYEFFIEVDSTYWHGLEYTEGTAKYKSLSKIQKRNIKNDKLKNRIAKEKGITLLRIKDKDLKTNRSKVIFDLLEMIT